MTEDSDFSALDEAAKQLSSKEKETLRNLKQHILTNVIIDTTKSSTLLFDELKICIENEEFIDQQFLYWNVDSVKKWSEIIYSQNYELYNTCLSELHRFLKTDFWKNCLSARKLKTFVNLGVGSGQKDNSIIASMVKHIDDKINYIPIDISLPMLEDTILSLSTIRQHDKSKVEIIPIKGDFRFLSHFKEYLNSNPNNAYFFLGSSIGNFEERDITKSLKKVLSKNDIFIVSFELYDEARESEVIDEITQNYNGEVNKAFVWQPLHLYGKKKPDDWSDRFSIIVSKDYSHIPRSVTFKTNYNDVDFGTITLAISTKYEYKSFCDFFAVNGFRKLLNN